MAPGRGIDLGDKPAMPGDALQTLNGVASSAGGRATEGGPS